MNFQNVKFITTAASFGEILGDRPHVVFSGRSNVGKSSLINALCGRKSLARVSSSPGKTIMPNFYDADGKLYFVDLPGYGYAKWSGDQKKRWSALVDEYLSKCAAIALTVQLIDLKVGPTADDRTMLDWLARTGRPFIVAATKADKLNKSERARAWEKLTAEPLLQSAKKVIAFSSVTNEGVDELRGVMRGLVM